MENRNGELIKRTTETNNHPVAQPVLKAAPPVPSSEPATRKEGQPPMTRKIIGAMLKPGRMLGLDKLATRAGLDQMARTHLPGHDTRRDVPDAHQDFPVSPSPE